MLGDQGLELTDQRVMAPELQVGLDPVFERDQTQFLEPRDLVLGEGLVGEVGQRRSATELERLGQGLGGDRRVAAVELLSPLGRQALEPVDIDLLGLDLEHVAATAGDERAVAQRLAQAGDVHLHCLDRRLRRPLAPELVGDPVGRDDLAAMEQQDRQHTALLRSL